MPTGLTIIARDKKSVNLTVATGLAMMRLSLARATVRIVTQISNKPAAVAIDRFQI